MFCPVCKRVYFGDERDSPMLQCGTCNRMLHPSKENWLLIVVLYIIIIIEVRVGLLQWL